MSVPGWVSVVEALGAPMSGILLYVLGRASKGGANQRALDSVIETASEHETRIAKVEATLVEHTTLLRGMVDLQRQILSVDRKLNAVCGKLGIEGTQ
jgi:hypothetical protein